MARWVSGGKKIVCSSLNGLITINNPKQFLTTNKQVLQPHREEAQWTRTMKKLKGIYILGEIWLNLLQSTLRPWIKIFHLHLPSKKTNVSQIWEKCLSYLLD